MNRKSLQLLILVILGTLTLLSSTVFATETRVMSMGNIGPFIRDNSNIFYFPSTILQYSNQAVAELRSKEDKDDYSIGIHLPISGDAVLGVYLNEPVSLPISYSSFASHVELTTAMTLIAGTKLQNFDLGLAFTMASDSWKDENSSVKMEESVRFYNLTAGISNPNMDVAVTLEFPGVSAKQDPDETSWSGFDFGVQGRYFMKKSDILELVPLGYLGIGSSSYEQKESSSKYERNGNTLDLSLALGINYQLGGNNIAVLGLEFFGLSKDVDEIKDGPKYTDTWTTLPAIFIGVESYLKPWLVTRIGANQEYYSYTSKYEPAEGGESTESTSSDSYFDLSFGFGIEMGGFVLDAAFNENLFFDGPNFISGQSNSIAHRISLIYKF